jgi:Flp pilus assembly pilin Flp
MSVLRLITTVRAFLLAQEAGATLVEYTVVLVLIASVTIAVMSLFGTSLRTVFSLLAGSI